MTLLNTADRLYLDVDEVDAVYLDEVQVWPPMAPAFSPSSLAGLAVWLDAVDYLPGSWPNKVAAGAAPTIVGIPSPAWAGGTLNGLPVVRFKPNEGRLRIHSDSGVTTEWTLVYVGRLVGPVVGRVVNGIYPPNNLLVGFWNGNKDVMYDNGFADNGQGVPVSDWAWKVYSGDGSGSVSRIFSDGTHLGSAQTASGWGGTFSLSGYGAFGTEETCDCEVAEVVQYNRKLSDAERQQVETYLRGKWGIT